MQSSSAAERLKSAKKILEYCGARDFLSRDREQGMLSGITFKLVSFIRLALECDYNGCIIIIAKYALGLNTASLAIYYIFAELYALFQDASSPSENPLRVRIPYGGKISRG